MVGANRLAITDLVGGDQPYKNGDSTRVAVFNGEIYNHNTLRNQLSRKYNFVDHCDGRVILPLYAEMGLDFPSRMDGMFAVAVVDQHSQQLLLATDKIGIKPLFYYWSEAQKTLYFASEMPALIQLSGYSPDMLPEGIDEYLTARTVFGNKTILKDIYRLPPGTVLIAKPGQKPCIMPYSTIDDREVMPSGVFDTDAAMLCELLKDEVSSLLVADVPVATMNSGGLDSSIVTAIAASQHPGIHSFHIKYRGKWPSDESAFASELASAANTTHHEIVADPADFASMIGDMAWCVGANADPIALSSKLLFRAVRRAGFKVILSGDGSDELFGGYERLALAMQDNSGSWVDRYIDSLAAVSRPLRERLYSDDFRHHLGRTPIASARLQERVCGLVKHHNGDRLAGLLEFEQKDRLPAYHLTRVDTTSMAHGVEARVPFLQGRVVRFSRRLASAHKINGDGVKRILYHAAKGLIPESILRRPKQPFTLPVAAMLTEGQPLFAYARDLLTPTAVQSRGFFKPTAVDELVRQHGKTPSNETGLAVWSLLMFEAFALEHGLR
jgi:asparagine synthase (glutamine-hydrolysing)